MPRHRTPCSPAPPAPLYCHAPAAVQYARPPRQADAFGLRHRHHLSLNQPLGAAATLQRCGRVRGLGQGEEMAAPQVR